MGVEMSVYQCTSYRVSFKHVLRVITYTVSLYGAYTGHIYISLDIPKFLTRAGTYTIRDELSGLSIAGTGIPRGYLPSEVWVGCASPSPRDTYLVKFGWGVPPPPPGILT